MKNNPKLTKRGYLKKNRDRIFKNNKVVLTKDERIVFAKNEIVRRLILEHQVNKFKIHEVYIDSYDPYMSVQLYVSPTEWTIGYSKRMPNDVPNDRIAIQVAVSRLIKRLKNG